MLTVDTLKEIGIIVGIVAPLCVGALAVLNGRGFSLGKLHIDGKEQPMSKEEIEAVATHAAEEAIAHYKAQQSKIIQTYKRFKGDVKEDVRQFMSGLFSLYRKTFITALKDSGVPADGISNHKDLLVYELALKKSSAEIIIKNTKKTIYQNHFPVRGEKDTPNWKESEEEFAQRLKEGFTKNTFNLIGGLSETDISMNWHIDSISRTDFEAKYLPTAHDKALEYANNLFLTVQSRRNLARDSIRRAFPELDNKFIEDEWEATYE